MIAQEFSGVTPGTASWPLSLDQTAYQAYVVGVRWQQCQRVHEHASSTSNLSYPDNVVKVQIAQKRLKLAVRDLPPPALAQAIKTRLQGIDDNLQEISQFDSNSPSSYYCDNELQITRDLKDLRLLLVDELKTSVSNGTLVTWFGLGVELAKGTYFEWKPARLPKPSELIADSFKWRDGRASVDQMLQALGLSFELVCPNGAYEDWKAQDDGSDIEERLIWDTLELGIDAMRIVAEPRSQTVTQITSDANNASPVSTRKKSERSSDCLQRDQELLAYDEEAKSKGIRNSNRYAFERYNEEHPEPRLKLRSKDVAKKGIQRARKAKQHQTHPMHSEPGAP